MEIIVLFCGVFVNIQTYQHSITADQRDINHFIAVSLLHNLAVTA